MALVLFPTGVENIFSMEKTQQTDSIDLRELLQGQFRIIRWASHQFSCIALVVGPQ